eukprot:1786171-Pyramimonas_sp.AAC.1
MEDTAECGTATWAPMVVSLGQLKEPCEGLGCPRDRVAAGRDDLDVEVVLRRRTLLGGIAIRVLTSRGPYWSFLRAS